MKHRLWVTGLPQWLPLVVFVAPGFAPQAPAPQPRGEEARSRAHRGDSLTDELARQFPFRTAGRGLTLQDTKAGLIVGLVPNAIP